MATSAVTHVREIAQQAAASMMERFGRKRSASGSEMAATSEPIAKRIRVSVTKMITVPTWAVRSGLQKVISAAAAVVPHRTTVAIAAPVVEQQPAKVIEASQKVVDAPTKDFPEPVKAIAEPVKAKALIEKVIEVTLANGSESKEGNVDSAESDSEESE